MYLSGLFRSRHTRMAYAGKVAFPKEFPMDHRNVLGELMHLGITRECVGDINLNDEEVQVILRERLRILSP